MSLVARARLHVTPLRIQMAIGFIAKGMTAAASFLLNWLIAREFGAAGVGLFSVAQATAMIGATLALMGLEYVTVRQVAKMLKTGLSGEARTTLRAVVRQTAIVALILAGALIAARETFARDILGQPGVSSILGVMACAIPIVAFTKIASAALRAAGNVLTSQMIDGPLGTGLAATVLAILVATDAVRSPLAPAILYCGFAGLAAIGGWLVLLRVMGNWDAAGGQPPALLRMGLPILAVAISQMFIDWFALVVLTAQGGAAQAGLFRIAFQIVSVLNLLNVASEGILAPVIAQAHAVGDKARIAVLLARTSAFLVLAGSPLLMLCLLAPEIILGLFGPEFSGAATALRVLAAGQLVNLALGPVGGVLIMTHHERWSLGFGVTSAALAAGLCLWLVPLHGVSGAAAAVALAILFRRIAAALIVRFVVGIELWRWRTPVEAHE